MRVDVVDLKKTFGQTDAVDGVSFSFTSGEVVGFVGPNGAVSLQEVFAGRRMLIVYHFMWKNGLPHHRRCEGCTHSQVAMNEMVRAYLAARDVSYAPIVLTSDPPRRRLSFVLDTTRYQAVVTLTGARGQIVPLR